jgi:small subunit ribosomal protein S20
MANTKSAAKRARQTETRTLANRRALTSIKSLLKKVRSEVGSKNKATAQAEASKLFSALDKAVKTGRIHANMASRHKSRLNSQIAAL